MLVTLELIFLCYGQFLRLFNSFQLSFLCQILLLNELKFTPVRCNIFLMSLFFQAFSPIMLPSLSHLNIRGNQLDQISVNDLLQLLKSFTLQTLEVISIKLVSKFMLKAAYFGTLSYATLQVDIPGPLGNSALQILEYLPNLSFLNGVSASVITETGKHVIDSALQPRLPEWAPSETLPDRVIGAMWLYLMTYRLADEEKIDETPVWYA